MTDDEDRSRSGGSPLGGHSGIRPSGDVAFLFTDLQGSTSAWEREPVAMNDVLARHDATLRTAIDAMGGTVFSIAGDAFGAAFHTIDDAVSSVLAAQRGLATDQWPSGLTPHVRMGLHVGRAFERDGNYFGPMVNRAARIMSAGHGGQVLMSAEARRALLALPADVAVSPLGNFLLRDLSDPIEIYQLSIAGLPCEFPPLRALDQSPRVVRPTGAFIGRDREMEQLRWWLETTPIVTIVAGGGIGKTRLAYESAAAAGSMFPDGVFAVELADGTAEEVVTRIAQTILDDDPVARTEHTDLLATLQRLLADQRTLLVLDNCEHVLDEAARVVAALTARCPRLTVLSTSRERLGVPGEQVLPLAPLSTERIDGVMSPAAELFLDRALSAEPALPVDQSTLDAIDQICSTVDGSALGIELAASRVRTLTPHQIAERLDDSMLILRRGRGPGPERHRSLEAAIAWSYESLGRDERRLLAWSSVFVGGFPLAAAEVLALEAGIDDVVDVVESLVEKSLLIAQRVGDRMRYRLPEPIRQFAQTRLDEMEQRERAVIAHFDHCKSHARGLVQLLDGHMNPPLFVSMSAELDNFLAAMRRATERGQTGDAMALAASLDLYWAETGHLAVAMQVMDSLVRSRPDDRHAAKVSVPLLWVATMCGELPRALEVRDDVAVQMNEQRLSATLMGGAAFGFGFIESALGNAAGAAAVWGAAGRAAAPVAPAIARQSLWSAGQSATAAGDQDLALSLYDAAEHVDGPVPGWFPTFIDVQRLVARAYAGDGDPDHIDRGVAALEDTGLRMRFTLASAFAAMGLFRSGAPGLAEHWWRRSMHHGREISNLWACWVMLECAAWSAMEDHDDTLAARFWHARDAFAAQRGYGLWPVLAEEGALRRATVESRSPLAFTDLLHAAPWSLAEAVEVALARAAAHRLMTQRIVIVGAGVSGLATAYALTDPQMNPGWERRYSVDVYQMGWRVGGKCATGRDADHHDRIQEHGIHVFGNMYFNSLRMVKAVQDEVMWDEHDRFRTMDTAFLPSVITWNTEWMNGQWHSYLGRFPLTDGVPWDGPVWPDLRQLIQGALSMVNQGLADALEGRRRPDENPWERMKGAVTHWLGDVLEDLVEEISERLVDEERGHDPDAADNDIVMRLMNKLVEMMEAHVRRNPDDVDLHMKFTNIDLVATALRGLLADDVVARGIDAIDDENYRDWLARHGMSDITLAAGLPQGFPNTALSYEYGDTTAIPTMSAAAWLTFFLRQVAGTGAGAYFFAEGTGETVMKPLFRLLEQRGVRFHFFHKLTAVTPEPTEPVIRSLTFAVQATVRGNGRYEPLRRLDDGELVWPDRPNFEQLVEGDELRSQGIDLESWWTPWTAVGTTVLEHGTDFDHVVLATPIATLPYTCPEVIAHPVARATWGPMVANIKTAATQAVQIWLDTTTEELGWPPDRVVPTDRYVGGFFQQDLTSFCDFSDLVAQERWPLDNTPKGLIYFIGALADPEEIPPFSDHDYPRRADERVKWSTIQFLRTINGLLPDAAHSPIDARSFDFDVLAAADPARRGRGINQFDQQYWRANIDPNERYTLTVKGTVKYRLKPWESQFDNLVLAGDWTYNGFNIGSFEGAVMSGKLASLALTGSPSLDEVYGYDFLHPDATGPTWARLDGPPRPA